jgi:phage baseplate assembly protein W
MRKREEVKYNPIDFEVDRAIGLTLPLTNDTSITSKYSPSTGITGDVEDASSTHGGGKAQGGFHLSYTTKEQAASNIRNLVLTSQNERVMHPNFGCNVWATMFENKTPQVVNELKERIQKQVKIWLPYINLMDVTVKDTDSNELHISIDFALYNNTMDRETIVINVRNK